MYDALLVKYGELALKKRNRKDFEDKLVQNINQHLRPFPDVKLEKTTGRIFVWLNGTQAVPVIETLQQVFGIVGISPVVRAPLEMEAMKRAAMTLMEPHDLEGHTFKVETRRANKHFPYASLEVSRQIGAHVLRRTDKLTVDVHEPDVTLFVEIRSREAYLYCEQFTGLGGLPVGVSGKVMVLLSGGIDSPVATFLTMKRGVEVEAVHFHSYPYTSERSLKKVEDLTKILSRYAGRITLNIVPFTDIQTQIREKCQESYNITVMRRFMFRISEWLARERGALALATGESLGQVASQTLESLHAINDAVQLPVLRPLISMDKQQIVTIAKTIGTYETSILPYEDCCTVFVPKSPVTRPSTARAREMEQRLDVDTLVKEAVNNTERKTITPETEAESFASYFDL